MSWRELWAVQRLGSKVSVKLSPAQDELSFGITNMISRTSVANSVTFEDARALALTLLEITGGMPVPARQICAAGSPEPSSFGGNHGRNY